ncbi:HIT-like protein [Linderina pennispora]|uniref:HIT-like protein n=1 Tax=Linderina pennispora TaxID=61395 RepID=A0A1Y1WN29_9FUNG|nr:HIT-like protein [Linderina pennispora]ORX74514.1 HIT-like protein [Linderina pennispora]
MGCVFCNIVAGSEPCHTVLEDSKHIAFLSISPNTPGFTVVIPKQHVDSDVLALDDSVDKVLRRGLKVDRCAVIIEGLMIDHAHTKLVPLHGLNGERSYVSEDIAYSELYKGYVTSMEGPRLGDAELAATLCQIQTNCDL